MVSDAESRGRLKFGKREKKDADDLKEQHDRARHKVIHTANKITMACGRCSCRSASAILCHVFTALFIAAGVVMR